jgi:hypothetical protein
MIREIGHALRILKEFVFWVLAKIVMHIAGLHTAYAKSVLKEPGFATFISFAFSLAMCIPIGLIALVYSGTGAVGLLAIEIWVWVAAAYYVFTLVSIAFKAFLMEREELMRQLKDSYDQ